MTLQLSGIDNEYAFELRPKTTMVLDRAVNSDCAVVEATVSQRHAEMAVTEEGIQVKDLGSSNGTFVNGVKIDSYFVAPRDTVNTASRLCGKAGAGEILVSEKFKDSLMTPPRMTPMPPMELKNKSQPVTVFKVVR